MSFKCSQITKIYQSPQGAVSALENITFKAHDQEFVCIVGPSGCGKTTLLKIIAGIAKPTSGEVEFSQTTPGDNHHAALVFQEHGVFPWLTVLDNVAFGLEMQGVGRRERRERAHAFIQKVGLTAFANNYPHELSVGMRQRVGLARAFLTDPQVLLMDEPFGSLDAQTKYLLQEELLAIWKQQKLVIYVTHDIEEAITLGDRVLVMSGRPGQIQEEIHIPLERPRALTAIEQPATKEIKWHIWNMLKNEARQNLSTNH